MTNTKAERHMVTIETERTGKITLTPAQFDLMLEAAIVGLEGYPDDGPETEKYDVMFNTITNALAAHTA